MTDTHNKQVIDGLRAALGTDKAELYAATLEAQNAILRNALQDILETANAAASGALHSVAWTPEIVASKARHALTKTTSTGVPKS